MLTATTRTFLNTKVNGSQSLDLQEANLQQPLLSNLLRKSHCVSFSGHRRGKSG